MLPLAGAPDLTVLGREVRLGSGYADLIAVESSGRVVIIEVKLDRNSEARRAVVGQVLSYAGYLQGLDPDQFESEILDQGADSAPKVDLDGLAGRSAAFRDGLARSLAEGSFRLVIVLDSAPDELIQVVGYLQSVTDKVDIDLVTVTAFNVGGSQILVPQRVDPGHRPQRLTTAQASERRDRAQFPGSAEFRAAIADAPPEQQAFLQRACDWAESLERQGLARLITSRAKLVNLLPQIVGDSAGLVRIYSDKKNAYMQFTRSVYERLAPNSIAAVEGALGAELTGGNTTRDLTDQLLDALTAAYHEAAASFGSA